MVTFQCYTKIITIYFYMYAVYRSDYGMYKQVKFNKIDLTNRNKK